VALDSSSCSFPLIPAFPCSDSDPIPMCLQRIPRGALAGPAPGVWIAFANPIALSIMTYSGSCVKSV
jgi:hypothetical protein